MNTDINNNEINVKLTNIDEFDGVIVNLTNSLNRIDSLFQEEKTGINNVFNNPQAWNGRAQRKV